MAVKADVVSVGTSPTQLTVYSNPDLGGSTGSTVSVHPASAIFIGGPDVSTASGYPVAGGVDLAVDLDMGERLYAVAASGFVSVNVLRTGI